MSNKKTVWQIKDGKRGHENQSSGLLRALSSLLPIEWIQIELSERKAFWLDYLLGRRITFADLERPDLIIGAGSGTHSTLLTAGRVMQAPTLVLMAPPVGIRHLFNWCIVPEHDGKAAKNIITTRGVLNPIGNNDTKNANTGLLLIGGPSKHHSWDCKTIIQQITTIAKLRPEIHWTATTSRRTPAASVAELKTFQAANIKLVPMEEADAEWLPQQLAHASYVWVTEDSVSMIYEAISSGARVGLLPVPRKGKSSRVLRGIDTLIADNQAMPYTQAHHDLRAFPLPSPLNEAERVAKILVTELAWN